MDKWEQRGQLGQNFLKDGDCIRDGDHRRGSYFPSNCHCSIDSGQTRNGYHTSNGAHHKGW